MFDAADACTIRHISPPEKWEVAWLFSSAIRRLSDPDEKKFLEQAALRAGLKRSGNRWVMPGNT